MFSSVVVMLVRMPSTTPASVALMPSHAAVRSDRIFSHETRKFSACSARAFAQYSFMPFHHSGMPLMKSWKDCHSCESVDVSTAQSSCRPVHRSLRSWQKPCHMALPSSVCVKKPYRAAARAMTPPTMSTNGFTDSAAVMPVRTVGSVASAVPIFQPASAASAPTRPHTAVVTRSPLSASHCSAPSVRLMRPSASALSMSGPPSFQTPDMASPIFLNTVAAFSMMDVSPIFSFR